MSEGMVPYKKACFISHGERDVSLNLDSPRWPVRPSVPDGWEMGRRCLQRTIAGDDHLMAGPVRETLLRFPSAPIHGWQRLHEYHVSLGQSENFHTYRVLSDPNCSEPAKRIFLMHNGLNELGSISLYYQLASHLVRSGPGTVCILRPFPGHLSRFPFPVFGETPLDRYLWDGSHLFREYLRYMVETQWFLSAIVRRSSYRSLAGANLLGEQHDPKLSRLEKTILAAQMSAAWRCLYRASSETLKTVRETQPDATTLKLPVRGDGRFVEAVLALRDALQLDTYPELGDQLEEGDREPSLHVLGYSLGGFTAQSVFMSWPFLIASCSTVLSGGALRELSPTAFAHAEEWQTVLHSLRYELDDAMMDGRNGRNSRTVAGMEPDLFLYLKRTFYEVFQQEYRGSFQSRLVAFMRRMLFVVGGNDPIVRTRNVLDSGPPAGINMLTIGGLSHFLASKAQDAMEAEQRLFWLPEMTELIHRFSDGATRKQREERPYTWVDEKMQFVAYPPIAAEQSEPGRLGEGYRATRLSAHERLAVARDGALPGQLFERYLDDMLARQNESEDAPGLLLILRNELPTLLMDDVSVYEHAEMLNHDDLGIARYVQGVRGRRKILMERHDRIALILPWNARRIMGWMDSHKGFPSQAEAPKGKLPGTDGVDADGERTDSWRTQFRTGEALYDDGRNRQSVRFFDGRRPLDPSSPLLSWAGKELHYPGMSQVPSLPDCWVWMSCEFLSGDAARLTVPCALEWLEQILPARCRDDKVLDKLLRNDDLRIVTVSRARYNPRFRGRVIVDPTTAKDLMIHVALCAASSIAATDEIVQTGEMSLP